MSTYSFTYPFFFLDHLAFDFSYTSSVTPNTLVDFLCEVKSITFYARAIQLCCFITFVVLWAVFTLESWSMTGMLPFATLYCMPPSCLKNSSIRSLLAHIFMDSLWVLHRQSQPHSSCLSVAPIGSTTSTVMTFPWSHWLALTHQRADAVNHCWVQHPLLSTDHDHFYVFMFFCHSEAPLCWRKAKSLSTCVSHLTFITIVYATVIFM